MVLFSLSGSPAEITCTVCHGEESNVPNEIVLCDLCGAGKQCNGHSLV